MLPNLQFDMLGLYVICVAGTLIIMLLLSPFFQQVIQISSHILDKKNKEQWSEVQKVRRLTEQN